MPVTGFTHMQFPTYKLPRACVPRPADRRCARSALRADADRLGHVNAKVSVPSYKAISYRSYRAVG